MVMVWNGNPNNVADSSGIFNNHQFPRSNNGLSPSSRKLVRLAFHDCLRSTDARGNLSGGCDGCLNWSGMDWLNELPVFNMDFILPMVPLIQERTSSTQNRQQQALNNCDGLAMDLHGPHLASRCKEPFIKSLEYRQVTC